MISPPPSHLPRGVLSGIPPHPSRYSLDTFSRLGEGFYSCAFSSCLTNLTNYRTQPRLIPAHNYAPVARRCNRRGLAKPDHRGNIQGDGWRLRRSGHANFPCHGAQNASAAFQFNSTDSHVTHRFFVTFFPEESNVLSPRPLLVLPPIPTQKAAR